MFPALYVSLFFPCPRWWSVSENSTCLPFIEMKRCWFLFTALSVVMGANYRDGCVVWALLISGLQLLVLPLNNLCRFVFRFLFVLFFCFVFFLILFNAVLSFKWHILLSHSGTFEFKLGFSSLKQKDVLFTCSSTASLVLKYCSPCPCRDRGSGPADAGDLPTPSLFPWTPNRLHSWILCNLQFTVSLRGNLAQPLPCAVDPCVIFLF